VSSAHALGSTRLLLIAMMKDDKLVAFHVA